MSIRTGSKSAINIGAVIVAAGLSTRMKAFKPLLPLGDSTIIRSGIISLQKAGVSPIVVVTGRQADDVVAHIADLQVETVHNANYSGTDMFHSACLGLAKVKERADRVFFLPADVPLFSPYSLASMNEFMDEGTADIVIPKYEGRQGHPVLIKNKLISSLLVFKGAGGLKGAIDHCGCAKETLPLPDMGLVLDADTQDDYQRLLEYASQAPANTPYSCQLNLSVGKNKLLIDETLAQLLSLTDKHRSLTEACKQVGISYSKGWKSIKLAEEALGFVLIKSSRGGASGGGSQLTLEGKRFVLAYQKLLKSIAKYSEKQFAKFFTED